MVVAPSSILLLRINRFPEKKIVGAAGWNSLRFSESLRNLVLFFD